jgi:hypothetical protein
LSFGVTATASVCKHDAEITEAWRPEAEKQASDFIAAVTGGDLGVAYNRLEAALKAKVPVSQFEAMATQVREMGPFSAAKFEHIYHPQTVGTGGSVVCITSGADGMVRVSALPLKTQVHFVYSATTQHNDWRWSLWLVENDGPWEVRGFYVTPSAVAGRDARDVMNLAKAQDAKGNGFNAFMLAAAGVTLTGRGPDISLGVQKEAEDLVGKIKRPALLAGDAPHKWTFDGTSFTVDAVQVVGSGKKLGLSIVHSDAGWDGKDNADAERRNRALIDGFAKAQPAYKDVFGIVGVRITRPGELQGWATLFDAEKGYLAPAGEEPAKAGKE